MNTLRLRMFIELVTNLITRLFSHIKTTNKSILFIVIIASFLSGCVQYDLGINYHNTNNGELVQHIQLSDKVVSFSGDYVYDWLDSLEKRTQKLDGSSRRISPAEVLVKIPFSNGKELEEKFYQFFNYRNAQKLDKAENKAELPSLQSNLLVEENNFLLLSRHKLIYDLDLRSLDVLTQDGNVLNNINSLLNLDFGLRTPWGAKSLQNTTDTIKPLKQGNHLVWQLQPGKLNHIEVVFWLPNLLGIGTLLIILFVWGGFYLKYNLKPPAA